MEPNGFEKALNEVAEDAERDMARFRLELRTVTDFDKLGYHPAKAEIDVELHRLDPYCSYCMGSGELRYVSMPCPYCNPQA